jgi:hypothetical protein
VRTPLGRLPASPALAFLRETAFRGAEPVARWADRLRAGGLVRELARARDLRRALPHLGRGIEAAGLLGALPADERTLLTAARLSSRVVADRLAATILPLGEACRREGVAPLLVKGAALHGGLHPDAADRPVSDADLVVSFDAWPRLARALDAAGLAPDRLTAARVADLEATGGRASFLSDLVFRRRDGTGLPVEAKLDPVQIGAPLRRAADFFAGATPSPIYPGFLVPAPEAMAVQQALHLARHDGSDALWIAELACGIHRAVAANRFDPARALALVEPDRLAGVLAASLAAAEAMFPGTIPPTLGRVRARGPVPAILRRSPRARGAADESAGTLSLRAFHAVASGRPGFVLRSLRTRLLPSDRYVAARMNLPAGAPVGFAARAGRLLALLSGRGSPR